MMYSLYLFSFISKFIIITTVLIKCQAYNILGVFPVRAYSHFVVLNSIAQELSNRGHNVTIYSRYLESFEEGTYRHIELKNCFPLKNSNNRYNSVEFVSSYGGILGFLWYVLTFIPQADDIKACQPLMELINSEEKYDLLLLESYNGNTDIYTGLSYKFKAPYVSVSTTMLYPWLSERIVTPDNPSYIPVPYTGFTSQMSFMQRLSNGIAYTISKLVYNYISIPKSEAVAKEIFGKSMPPLQNILENCSLTFSYTHHSISPIRPLAPNVIEIAGVNIKGQEPLPMDMEKFINESSHGVVYFSMGSFIHSKMFPPYLLEAFLKAFEKIPQRVIWKYESAQSNSIKSDKIYTAKWMPQKDILAHPNVKLFISHGGLLGLNEAVNAGVPVLGIPIFADQSTNINMLKSHGSADILNYSEINEHNLYSKIMSLINDYSYQWNAKNLSLRYRDRQRTPQESVVYWSEYVIRHNAAHHLQISASKMPFYQYLLIDVIIIMFVIFVICLMLTYFVCYYSAIHIIKILKKQKLD